MIALSVLDQVPHFRGKTAAQALQESIVLAQSVERWGYRRFWIAEHHNMGHFACASPEILAAVIAEHTRYLRIGSGGIMLSNYSPLKVAETFRLLNTLYPQRIDLGIGRGSGANPPAMRALQPHNPFLQEGPSSTTHHRQTDADPYLQQVHSLLDFLVDRDSEDSSYPNVHALPLDVQAPEVWMLGTNHRSAATAALLGLPFCFAQFTNMQIMPQILEHYRYAFRPSPFLAAPRAFLAVRALCAESEEEAARHARSFWLVCMGVHKYKEKGVTDAHGYAPSLEEAVRYEYTSQEHEYIQQRSLMSITGTPMQVKQQLETLAEHYAVDELMLLTFCPDAQVRLRSYQLLSEAFSLCAR